MILLVDEGTLLLDANRKVALASLVAVLGIGYGLGSIAKVEIEILVDLDPALALLGSTSRIPSASR